MSNIEEKELKQQLMQKDKETLVELLLQKMFDCKVVEQELAESEKRFVVANNLRKKSDEVLLNYKTEKYGLDKTIQELRKIKLSMPEKEWYYKGFENYERQISSHIADLTLENKQLKQQLAEKDKEIEDCKRNELYEENMKILAVKNQTQLAIQELEKVRSCCENYALELDKCKDNEANNEIIKYLYIISEIIDNQIKKLKGE